MRLILSVLFLALLTAACGGDDPSGPALPRFPEVQGVYDYSAIVNGLPGARFAGTVAILDDSRDTETFTGSFDIRLIGPNGSVELISTGDLDAGRVTEAGAIFFNFDDSDFRNTGTLGSGSITGNWILTGGGDAFAGTFTAVRR